MGLGRRLTVEGGLGPLGVVEADPRADDPFGVQAVGQLADLGVKVADLRFMVPAGAVGTVRKHLAQTVHRLALPRAYLVWMHLVPGRVRRENDSLNRFLILLTLDRLVATERLKRNLGLEIRREPTPSRHLVFLRYPVEYTLSPLSDFLGPPH